MSVLSVASATNVMATVFICKAVQRYMGAFHPEISYHLTTIEPACGQRHLYRLCLKGTSDTQLL